MRRSARSEKYCPKVSGRISSHLSDLDFRQIGKSFTPRPLSATIYFFTNTHIDKIIVHNCTHIDNICTWSCTWYLISLSLPLLYFLKDIWGWCFFLTIPIHPLCYNNLRLRFLNIFILRYVVCFPHRIVQTACRGVYLGFKDLSSVAAPRFCSLPWNLAAR